MSISQLEKLFKKLGKSVKDGNVSELRKTSAQIKEAIPVLNSTRIALDPQINTDNKKSQQRGTHG
ncbi:hypothetical protein MK805_13875 [Shimazuella sp. AN120528]|uniref:hypothetical protein n=1 Tax=Shimazuella soli TaxID=1892854 RepID=UPI001F0EC06E|nr:hypothetical protein [Shimazuella soli]MCH5586027.1 hypothetical protein [Shimazuella soli]